MKIRVPVLADSHKVKGFNCTARVTDIEFNDTVTGEILVADYIEVPVELEYLNTADLFKQYGVEKDILTKFPILYMKDRKGADSLHPYDAVLRTTVNLDFNLGDPKKPANEANRASYIISKDKSCMDREVHLSRDCYPTVDYCGDTVLLRDVPLDVTVEPQSYESIIDTIITSFTLRLGTDLNAFRRAMPRMKEVKLNYNLHCLEGTTIIERICKGGSFPNLESIVTDEISLLEQFIELTGIKELETLTITHNSSVNLPELKVKKLILYHPVKVTLAEVGEAVVYLRDRDKMPVPYSDNDEYKQVHPTQYSQDEVIGLHDIDLTLLRKRKNTKLTRFFHTSAESKDTGNVVHTSFYLTINLETQFIADN